MMQTEVITVADTVTLYQIVRLDKSTGRFIMKLPEFGKHQELGGMWSDQQEVEHEVLTEALKGTQWRIIKMEWTL